MTDNKPKYQVVIDWINEEIASGRMRIGDRLMPEEKLSKKFGLCRQTIRRATSQLVEEKVLTRLQGSGTYVGQILPHTPKKKHMNVAVVSTYYNSYIFPPTLRGIERTLSDAGNARWLSFTDNRVERVRVILEDILRKNNIDGLIVEAAKGALPNPNLSYYKELQKRNIPIIFFNDMYPGLDVPCVRLDDQCVTYKATKFLIQSGHKRIAGIFKLDDGQGRRRYSGYIDALREAEIQLNSRTTIWIDTDSELNLWEIEEHLFRRIKGCTGIVCYNDEVAVEVIDLALKRNIKIPQDLSIISIDDSELAQMSKVPFTSYSHPKEILGEKTAQNLLQMIENPAFDGNYLFESQAVVRDSIRQI